MDYPGLDGFLGTRASLMLDVVVVSMFGVLVLLAVSIYLVRFRKAYQWHKRIQVGLTFVLFLVVAAFEADMRIYGWQERASAEPGGSPTPAVWAALYVHLVFAISTFCLWPVVVFRAWRNFPVPPRPGTHSRWHRRWARLAAADMVLTAVTGWVFYVVAFVL